MREPDPDQNGRAVLAAVLYVLFLLTLLGLFAPQQLPPLHGDAVAAGHLSEPERWR